MDVRRVSSGDDEDKRGIGIRVSGERDKWMVVMCGAQGEDKASNAGSCSESR